jgi:hypothetical protein
MGDWTDAVHCRNHAALLRTIADESEHDDRKSALRRAAEYYEKIADAMERDLRNAPAPG